MTKYRYFLIANDQIVKTYNRNQKLTDKQINDILNNNYKKYGNNIWID
jgi:hypothetical protein